MLDDDQESSEIVEVEGFHFAKASLMLRIILQTFIYITRSVMVRQLRVSKPPGRLDEKENPNGRGIERIGT